MPSSFILTLDRQTSLAVEINGGAPSTELDTVTLELDFDPDAVLVKIWGDINPLDPANENYGETEEEAPWIPVSPSFLVNVTTNPGQKRLSARVKDDVDNEAVDTDTIHFGEEAPLPPPTQRPKAVPGKPKPPRPEPQLQEVRAASVGVALTTSATVQVRSASRSRGVITETLPSLVRGRATTASSGIQVTTHVHAYVRMAVKPGPGVIVGPPAPVLIRHTDGDSMVAVLEALGEL